MARQNPCPVPGCQRNRLITSKYGVCAVHNDQFEGITYYMSQMRAGLAQDQKAAARKGARPGDKVTPSGIFLP